MRIVVPDDFPPVLSGSAAERELARLGALEVHTARGANLESELARRIAGADVVLNIRAHARYSAPVIASCPTLRHISVWGSGTDNIDLAACKRAGIVVTNTAGVNANAVAEHTIALMLSVARRIPEMDRAVRAGEWPRHVMLSLEGKTLGVIGLGAIGKRVALLANAFGMRVLAMTFGADNGRAKAAGARAASLDALLRESNFVSLHLRLSSATTNYLNRERLQSMKSGAVLINTARAALVERDALVDALRHGPLSGAGLDVFHQEPVAADEALLRLPNVVLTPHDAGMTREVIDNGLALAVENVRAFLDGRPQNVVESPTI